MNRRVKLSDGEQTALLGETDGSLRLNSWPAQLTSEGAVIPVMPHSIFFFIMMNLFQSIKLPMGQI